MLNFYDGDYYFVYLELPFFSQKFSLNNDSLLYAVFFDLNAAKHFVDLKCSEFMPCFIADKNKNIIY